MHQSEKLLGVIVIEVGVVVLGGQVFAELPVTAGEVELIAFSGTANSGKSRPIR
ncbi:hypothetical protein HK44_008665 [Pseudomonas fluorescens HK44]|uniref:Uncharacterized protein n=1 Tax=Pseudomonas fluorescens HK44 TaxID=1042209 RepID=A0A010ST56_PSEFL|nr:hypothetical protein HK44_008665 [Pseudomonas fluorescens HK44]